MAPSTRAKSASRTVASRASTQWCRLRSAPTATTYEHDGRSGDIDLLLWPVNFTLAFVGYEILTPYVAYGVEAGLRYSDPGAIEERLKAVVANFGATLPRFSEREPVPFNRMEEWGPHRSRRPGPLAFHPAKKATSLGVTWRTIGGRGDLAARTSSIGLSLLISPLS